MLFNANKPAKRQPTRPPEFDSSRHFRQVDFNEINHLEAIFTFFCGGTFFQYKLLIACSSVSDTVGACTSRSPPPVHVATSSS